LKYKDLKKSKITIHDLSKALGIDSSTISRALNDSPRVKPETKEKVRNLATELGYQKNQLASKLRSSKSNSIGVIVPRISRHFFSSVIAGIEETAYKLGYDVIICQSLDKLDRERKLMETMLSNRVDGVLVSLSMETDDFQHFEHYIDNDHPIVFFDRPCKVGEFTNVIIDDFQASFNATEHLINNGFKNIAHFSGPQLVQMYQNRRQGYEEALRKYNLEVRPEYVLESNLMVEDGTANAKKLLELPKIDAVFSANDMASFGAMKYLKDQGVKIPDDIAFVGFSDEPVSSYIDPPLSTIKQPDFEMGQTSANLLVKLINDEEPNSINKTIVLKAELIVRSSSEKKQ
jgi:LacI family transcriptional regulator